MATYENEVNLKTNQVKKGLIPLYWWPTMKQAAMQTKRGIRKLRLTATKIRLVKLRRQ